jgi:hypothetical protein
MTTAPLFKQKLLMDLIGQCPKGPTYHYTTIEALKGIVGGKAVWATHHQHLNDNQEFLYCKELLRTELGTCTTYPKAVRDRILTHLHGQGFEDVNIYVASFSKELDSKSQWRDYAGHTSPVCLWFRLDEVELPESFHFAECIYEADQHRRIVAAIIAELANASFDPPTEWAFLRRCLHELSVMMKRKSFETENEWRIVSRVLGPFTYTECPLGSRPGKIGPIPHRVLPLLRKDGTLALTHVMVGPCPDVTKLEDSVRHFLDSHGLRHIPVTRSTFA